MRIAEQQQIEILRALARDAQLIVMDEPSAALGRSDAQRLHEIIRSLAAAGTTVLLVSHFLREVLELADTVTVLRDGRLVRSSAASQETEESLIQAMLGRPLGAVFPPKPKPRADAEVALSVRRLSGPGVDGCFARRARGRDRRPRGARRRRPHGAGARDLRCRFAEPVERRARRRAARGRRPGSRLRAGWR